ncbi:hypothetical protein A9Q87_00690 [Flavobacteriales bacterium 34_180_T64]|nr:hypothetical protein A9Q87_00690 [Flavobacteriales bacterium 34_180_T64]
MLAKFKTFLYKSIQNKKLNVFGVFLLLSFMILVITKLSKKYTQSLSFDLTYVNVPENAVISSGKQPTLDITLTALGFNLLPYYLYDRTLSIDFESDVSLIQDQYIWIANKQQHDLESVFGNSIVIESIEQDSLKFSFETLEIKRVPIRLNSNITYASGYDISQDLEIIPDSVNVVGAKNDIDSIQELFTNSLSLNNINVDINTIIGIKLPDSIIDVKLMHDKVAVKGKVEKFTEGTIDIPISIINLPSDITINYFPKSVSVSYYVSLNNYNSVKDLDFQVVCDFKQTKTAQRLFFTPQLTKKPEVVKSARIKQGKIEYIIIE